MQIHTFRGKALRRQETDVICAAKPHPHYSERTLIRTYKRAQHETNTLTASIVTTYTGFNLVAQASAPEPVFTPAQEANIGEIAAGFSGSS